MNAPRPAPHRHGPVYRALLRYSRALHTYVSMLALIAFAFFAGTGFMLNHPDWFGLDETTTSESTFTLATDALTNKDKLAVVEALRRHGATGAVKPFDWPGDGDPFHIAFKSPGASCDADITLPGGETHLTVQSRGLAGWMTRLHTAKDAGSVWRFLLDASAVLLLFVCVSGVILWQSLPKRRKIGIAAFVSSILAITAIYWLFVP